MKISGRNDEIVDFLTKLETRHHAQIKEFESTITDRDKTIMALTMNLMHLKEELKKHDNRTAETGTA